MKSFSAENFKKTSKILVLTSSANITSYYHDIRDIRGQRVMGPGLKPSANAVQTPLAFPHNVVGQLMTV